MHVVLKNSRGIVSLKARGTFSCSFSLIWLVAFYYISIKRTEQNSILLWLFFWEALKCFGSTMCWMRIFDYVHPVNNLHDEGCFIAHPKVKHRFWFQNRAILLLVIRPALLKDWSSPLSERQGKDTLGVHWKSTPAFFSWFTVLWLHMKRNFVYCCCFFT